MRKLEMWSASSFTKTAQPLERAVHRDDRARCVRPHVTVRRHAKAIGGDRLHIGNARNGRKPPRDATALGFHLDDKTGSEHLGRKLADRAHHHDTPCLEQRDAIADALHLIEQMG
jgi:hypothetical protein